MWIVQDPHTTMLVSIGPNQLLRQRSWSIRIPIVCSLDVHRVKCVLGKCNLIGIRMMCCDKKHAYKLTFIDKSVVLHVQLCTFISIDFIHYPIVYI